MIRSDLDLVVCPACLGPLAYSGTGAGDDLGEGELRCAACHRRWPVRDGLAYLFDESEVRGLDWISRLSYDVLAAFHDPAVKLLLPLLQLEGASRDPYMRRLELAKLKPTRSGRPRRVLEIGVGAGANLPLIERDLPAGLDAEIWGVDLSSGMIAACRRRLRHSRVRRVRLLLADAHALPFPDDTFDRVFHVGGIAAYRDPRRGLAEMARVARPRTPIVVVDEQLDPDRSHWWHQRLLFQLTELTGALTAAPVAFLPAGAKRVRREQTSRFYYCLSFRMGARRKEKTAAG